MSIRKLFIFLFVVSIFVIAFVFPRDPDLWWHLKTGEYVVQNGIPETEPGFSYTAQGNEWFMHEWLSEVIMYLVYDLGGINLISVFFTIIIGLTWLQVYAASNGKPYLAAFVTFWGMLAGIRYFGARPQMFNLFFAALYILIVERYLYTGLSKRWLWVIPIAMLIWVNLHSGFLLGIVILGVYIVGRFAENRFKADEITLELFKIAVLTVATSLINPKLFGIWLYPFTTTFNSNAMQTYIEEWLSPDFHYRLAWFFGALLIGGLISLSLSPRKPTITELLLITGAGAASLQQQRNIPIFAILAVPIICRHLNSFPAANRFLSKPDLAIKPVLSKLNLVLAIIGIFAGFAYILQNINKIDAVVAGDYPEKAVDYIYDNDLQDKHLYHNYRWGGYLIWREIPTFIDGRADIYGDEFIQEYVDTITASDDWQDILEKHDVELALVEEPGIVDMLLELTGDWELILEDGDALLYERLP